MAEPLVAVPVPLFARRRIDRWKRALDVVLATVLLALFSPVIAFCALAVRLASPGPAFFRARRVGRGGVPFEMLKLRTMHVHAPQGAALVTAADDPRVFPLGGFLRRTKIDELPQLVNVLRGEMSFIGPRPEDPHFVREEYTREHCITLAVRPGLSSPGSLYYMNEGEEALRGPESEVVYTRELLPTKLALDLFYVRRISIAYDLRLIARTCRLVLARALGLVRPNPTPELDALVRRGRDAGDELSRWRGRRRIDRWDPRQAAVVAIIVACASASCATSIESPNALWLTDSNETILVGAGDIGRCDSTDDDATAALLDDIPGTVFTTGDNAYPSGTASQFADCYGPSWGRHRDRTRPTPGNHDYEAPGGPGYHAYFGARAGSAGLGYYSYDLGDWHVIALNSEIAMDAASPQIAWLRDDLGSNASVRCVAAYWHRPLFSSGDEHGNDPRSRAAWDLLYAFGADLVLGGHDHTYERFAPQDPTGAFDRSHGIRQFVIGTGGASPYDFGAPIANSQVRRSGDPGVLALRLLPDSYEWRFVTVGSETFADAGSGTCHDAPEGTP